MKTFSRIFLITLLGIISVPIARADELPRHGVIGLAVAPPDTTKPDDVHTNPPTVKTVAPGSAGEAAGILPGDIPLELDGARVTSSTEFAARIGRHLAGDRVPILISRNGKELTLSAVLKPRPYETSPDAEVIYSSVTVEGTRRRTIITRPKAPGRFRLSSACMIAAA